MNEYLQKMWEFLSSSWHIWTIYAIAALVGYIIYWYLKERRDYKVIEGKLFVRHGRFGHWINVEEHMKKDHKEE